MPVELVLTDDQEFFRDTTRKFLDQECPIATVRQLAGSDAGLMPDYWRRGAELGWTSLLVPESLGGGTVSGSGVADLALLADAFGAQVAPGPLLPTNVVAATIARSGTAEQCEQILPALLAGETTAAWAFTEPAAATFDLPQLTATPDGNGFVLRGTKEPVEAGADADSLLVSATSHGAPLQFLVDRATDGIRVERLESLDLVRRFARVEFDDVRVPRRAMVGDAADAALDIERQLQLAAVVQCAESVGAADAAFRMTLDWAFNRYTFGRPLASYQAIKHRFADMKMWLEASHAITAEAARGVQEEGASAAETASVAKAYVGEYLPELIQDCVQIHGGIGVTYEHDIHLYLRRVTVNRLTFGTPAEHRARVGRLRIEEGS
jgi:alkylation response protein AidB-like acyl-CoA dehydrogenase